MGKNDIIICFNQSECIYAKCVVYNDTLSACELEWLKRIPVQGTTKPSQAQASAHAVPVSQTPWVNPNPKEQQSTQPAQQGKKPFTNCKDVIEGMKNFKIHGKIIDDPIQQELNTRKGPMTVVKALLDDGTAKLRITFWDINKIPAMEVGNEITVEGLMGSAPYDGLPQASGGQFTKVIFEKA